MSSLLDICNSALTLLAASRINSINEESQGARLCLQHWDNVRDEVLRSHDWVCCQDMRTIGALAEKPAWGWDYAYLIPGDVLRISQVADRSGNIIDNWQRVGPNILCNEPSPLCLLYVRRDENTLNYDSLLRAALAECLASKLAYPLTGSTTMAESMLAKYERTLTQARGVNARETGNNHKIVQHSSWLTAKYGG
ncbi:MULTISPECIES: hypothetical protein [unclassified Maridesulfovibrio]|uniref:hypothetical protein n=1 Tax=unclassified Maridesulfovibrio TaxID=2794999 RepID=UPI003B3D4D25